MAKLKERQFYNVGLQRREMAPANKIKLKKMKNGRFALKYVNRSGDKMYKFVKQSAVKRLKKKYGSGRRSPVRRRRRRRSPVRRRRRRSPVRRRKRRSPVRRRKRRSPVRRRRRRTTNTPYIFL